MEAIDAIEWACVLCGHHIQNDWVEQGICIKFCIKLKHASTEIIQMIQKATAMGNWWLAASSWQNVCSCIMSHADFFGKPSNHPVAQPTVAQIWHPVTSCFSQDSNHLWKGRDFRSLRFRKIWRCRWWWLGELCEVPRCLLWSNWGIIFLCTMFLVSCIFFNKCLYFSYYMAGYLLDRPHMAIPGITFLKFENFWIPKHIYPMSQVAWFNIPASQNLRLFIFALNFTSLEASCRRK